jgi:hypothetical protein
MHCFAFSSEDPEGGRYKQVPTVLEAGTPKTGAIPPTSMTGWLCAFPCGAPRPSLSPAMSLGSPRHVLRPKSLSPKSHAHPARGWWWWTHIYRGHEVDRERLKGEDEMIVICDQNDEWTRWTEPWITDLDLGLSREYKELGVNDALILHVL